MEALAINREESRLRVAPELRDAQYERDGVELDEEFQEKSVVGKKPGHEGHPARAGGPFLLPPGDGLVVFKDKIDQFFTVLIFIESKYGRFFPF